MHSKGNSFQSSDPWFFYLMIRQLGSPGQSKCKRMFIRGQDKFGRLLHTVHHGIWLKHRFLVMADIVPVAFPSLPVPTFQLLGHWMPHQLP